MTIGLLCGDFIYYAVHVCRKFFLLVLPGTMRTYKRDAVGCEYVLFSNSLGVRFCQELAKLDDF